MPGKINLKRKRKQEEKMKKFWIVLLSVALIMAFAMPVCAADVKFSGSYVAQGFYDNNRALMKEGGASVQNVWQRVRMLADFQVQEGLKFSLGFDALEKIWGAPRTVAYTPTYSSTGFPTSTGGEQENIHMNLAYVSANLWGGLLRAGYQRLGQFGTSFGDSGDYAYGPRVRYDYTVGPWTLIALWEKPEGTKYYAPGGPAVNVANPLYQVDQEGDSYVAAFVYNWGKGNTGLLYKFFNDSQTAGTNPVPATDTGYKRQWHILNPYVKAQMGGLYVEAEGIYMTGKTRKYETAGNGTDRTKDGLSLYVSGTYDFAPMYAGLTLVYVAGDDLSTNDKDESGWPGHVDFNPCLMLFNFDLARWNGTMGPAQVAMSSGISNAQFAQLFFGIKPVPKLDIKASYTVAQADKEAAVSGWVSKNYGSEFDLTATYKIYDNLSYMVGFAYLWAGDYFKGTNSTITVDNDYLVTHKLTLTF